LLDKFDWAGIKSNIPRLSLVEPKEADVPPDAPTDLLNQDDRSRFEAIVMPHLDAAYNLARWLLGGRSEAEDVTQDAMLRAYRFFNTFHSGDARAWLLQIVRNCCYTWLQKNRNWVDVDELDDTSVPREKDTPETLAISVNDRERLTRALEQLSPHFREILVLRELEGCSYKEIAAITSRPMGTIMSALARARQQLRVLLTEPAPKEARLEL
jgi:RNA polymerase sigma-70 factor, ECF subfamily